jgi:hypothetical protein
MQVTLPIEPLSFWGRRLFNDAAESGAGLETFNSIRTYLGLRDNRGPQEQVLLQGIEAELE